MCVWWNCTSVHSTATEWPVSFFLLKKMQQHRCDTTKMKQEVLVCCRFFMYRCNHNNAQQKTSTIMHIWTCIWTTWMQTAPFLGVEISLHISVFTCSGLIFYLSCIGFHLFKLRFFLPFIGRVYLFCDKTFFSHHRKQMHPNKLFSISKSQTCSPNHKKMPKIIYHILFQRPVAEVLIFSLLELEPTKKNLRSFRINMLR